MTVNWLYVQKNHFVQVPDVNQVVDSHDASVQWMAEKSQCLKISPVSAVGMTGFPFSVLTKSGKRKFKPHFFSSFHTLHYIVSFPCIEEHGNDTQQCC